MGMWDEYCTVCGGPTYVLFDDMDAESEPLPPPLPNPADFTWLESLIGISNKEELIPLANYDSYGSFDIVQPDTSLYSYSYFCIGRLNENIVDKKAARGYACHATCFNLLQQELNYTLKHADLLPLLNNDEYDCNSFSWSDYGGLKEYQEQSFGDVQLVRDGKLWMIEDPSRDRQNKERILQLWRPLVESGFQRPDAKAGDDGSSVTEIAETNMDASGA